MKKKITKCLCIVLVFVLMFTCTAFASSYNCSINFKVACQGATREFDGQNITYGGTMKGDWVHATCYEYTVALYRKKLIGSTYIGEAKLLRDTYDSCTWSNVGAGKYYLYFSKANDGVTLSSNDIIITN